MKTLHQAPIDLFWYWIKERHGIYLKKEKGKKKPWTEDVILQNYKFTNPFRQNDKTTQWLTKKFIKPHAEDKSLLLFNICWFRLFNLIETGKDVSYIKKYDALPKRIDFRYKRGDKLFTSAFMMMGLRGEPKHISILRTCELIWNNRKNLYRRIKDRNLMEDAFKFLVRYPMIGNFYAYEIVCDLRHTHILEKATDINTWSNVGPGAERGLRRIYPDIEKKELLSAMKLLLDESWRALGKKVPRFELRDIEHSLCEFDKYCRVKFNEGTPKERYPGKEEIC